MRPVDVRWVDHMGQKYLYLRDPVAMDGAGALVPGPMAPLIALFDGTRDISGLQSALALRTGLQLTASQINSLLYQLDEALLLDSDRYHQAHIEALAAYRSAPFRHPSRAGGVYPAEPGDLKRTLVEYIDQVEDKGPIEPGATPVGVVCPHIDYQRGHATYAKLWQRIERSVDQVDLAIILGTDHAGSPGRLTLTRQDYATPWGPLPTDHATVDELVSVLGEEAAFDEELHHAGEHSIELVLVWLHHYLGQRSCQVLPILCGSFHPYVEGADPDAEPSLVEAMEVIRRRMDGSRCLIIAAADLAHVGPAFGDPYPWGLAEREQLRAQDARLLEAACLGDEESFLDQGTGSAFAAWPQYTWLSGCWAQ